MTPIRILLVATWLLIAGITLWAMLALGLVAAAETFASDLRHPWRAQFYADLEAQLLLLAIWILYREPTRRRGLSFAVLTFLLGALFTLPYVVAASLRARGDPRALLLGGRLTT